MNKISNSLKTSTDFFWKTDISYGWYNTLINSISVCSARPLIGRCITKAGANSTILRIINTSRKLSLNNYTKIERKELCFKNFQCVPCFRQIKVKIYYFGINVFIYMSNVPNVFKIRSSIRYFFTIECSAFDYNFCFVSLILKIKFVKFNILLFFKLYSYLLFSS